MSSVDGKESAHHHDRAAATRSKRRGGHCKRFWWIYLILFVIIAVLAVVLIIFVAVPKIAQSKINAATLDIQGVNVFKTETNSYQFQINSTITTDGSISANIDPFVGDLYLEDSLPHTPFVSVNFPKTNGDKHQVVNVTQDVVITDHDAYNKFNIWFFNNDTLRVTVSGNTYVQPNGLSRKYSVSFKKTITLNGLNLLQGTKILDGHIDTTPGASPNFNGTSEIPNQSVFTLDIGDATFNNYVGDELLGNTTINNLFLRPGSNKVELTSTLDQAKVVTLATAQPYCKTGSLPVKLLGTKVVNNGQSLDYFKDALASANQTVPLNVGSILGATLSCS